MSGKAATKTGKIKKGKLPKPKEPSEQLAGLERPGIKWQTVGTVAGAAVILWVTALMMNAYIGGVWGWVPVGVVAALTAAAVGFGIYVWRLTRKSRGIVDILAKATDAEGRKRAIEELEQREGGDAMAALARAQLVARERPPEAMKILEGIELDKAPAVVQDDIRANLAYMYLMTNRAKDARELVDGLKLGRQPNAKAKAMYAAVSAEAFARTGRADEASKLLETFNPDDDAYGEVRAMLLRAQVFMAAATRKNGLAVTALKKLGQVDPNMLMGFLSKGTRPEVQKLAKKALKSMGMQPRQKVRMQRR